MADASATQLIIALVGVLGVAVGGLITWAVQARLLSKRISADESLASKKFSFDSDLAERRFIYDRDLHDHKRKVEFAEELLAQFYQARDVIRAIRSPGSFSHEGRERDGRDQEPEDQREQIDTYYVTISRISKHSEFIANVSSKKYRARVMLGASVTDAFEQLDSVIIEIHVAATTLIRMIRRGSDAITRNADLWDKCEQKVWDGYSESDQIRARVEACVQVVEDICRPILERSNPK